MKSTKILAIMVLALVFMVCPYNMSMAWADVNTKLLIHCDGDDGSQDFPDSSPSGHIITAQGNAQVDTDYKKWGTGSCMLDGDSDYLEIADSADWDISTNWTLDFWIKWNSLGYQFLINQEEDASNDWYIYMLANVIRFTIRSGAADIVLVVGGSISDTNWHHIAVIRKDGRYWGIYIDGTQTGYTDDTSMDTFAGTLSIGRYGSGGYYFNGNMDEVHISHDNHFSAYPKSDNSDTITVPTGPYSDDQAILSLCVNNQPLDSITLEVSKSCTFEVISDDSNPYNAFIGFDNGLALGSFAHIETRPEAGDIAGAIEYNVAGFGGYYITADGLVVLPSAGIHFVFQYIAQQVGVTELKLYDETLTSVIDSVQITVTPTKMGRGFTYQGRLMDANNPADGLYDFQFKLYDAPTDGNQLESTNDINDLDVIDGFFVVILDFGSDVFNGQGRWLQTAVRPGDSNDVNDFITLSPRHEITPVPYALQTRGIFVDDDGNIGIGNTNPAARLDVNGNISVNGIPIINILGQWIGDPVGLQGPPGPKGDKPAHQWNNTRLRFENPDGSWGSYVDLRGPEGPPGPPVSTFAVCVQGEKYIQVDCDCGTASLLKKVYGCPCEVTSDGGSCQAQGHYVGSTCYKGACCVCSPE